MKVQHHGTMSDLYQQQIEHEKALKELARERAAANIIDMAYRTKWPKEDLIMVLQLLGLDDGWIGERIANVAT